MLLPGAVHMKIFYTKTLTSLMLFIEYNAPQAELLNIIISLIIALISDLNEIINIGTTCRLNRTKIIHMIKLN